MTALRGDAARLFLTAMLVYAAFWNPWLHSSMAWNYLDAAVSVVDTGRWDLAHRGLYHASDTAVVGGRVILGFPPGMTALVVPVYALWRGLVGPVATAGEFQAFHGFLALAFGATASALTAVQVAWLAGWLGAGRRGRLWAALLLAFGTQYFAFGTMLFKESLAGLLVITALRLAVEPGGPGRRALAGAAAGLAAGLMHPAGLLALLLVGLVARREGVRRSAAAVLGGLPVALALGAYNTWLFGRPWRSVYGFTIGHTNLGFATPHPVVLLELLAGQSGGLFLYSPFLLLGVAGLVHAGRTARRGEAAVTALFAGGITLAATAWLSQWDVVRSAGLGPRNLAPAIPLLAAFAGPRLERASLPVLGLLALPSLAFGYLGAQAGFIPGTALLPYAVKTWVSGTGMGVLFKEGLPAWLGLETLHTAVSRPDVSAADVLARLPTPDGWRLVRAQALCLAANLVALAAVGLGVTRLWRVPAAAPAPSRPGPPPPSGPRPDARWSVGPAGSADAGAMARIHRTTIPEGFLPRLGEGVLGEIYAAALGAPRTVALTARSGAALLGFLVATEDTGAFFRHVLLHRGHRLIPRLLRVLARDPGALAPMLESLRYPRARDRRAWRGPKEAELIALAVVPEHHGLGVAGAMLAALHADLARRHIPGYTVSVYASNEAARAFYRRMGLEPAREFAMYGKPWLVYRCRLAGGPAPAPAEVDEQPARVR